MTNIASLLVLHAIIAASVRYNAVRSVMRATLPNAWNVHDEHESITSYTAVDSPNSREHEYLKISPASGKVLEGGNM